MWWTWTDLCCSLGPLPSPPRSRLIPSQRDQLFLGPKPPGRLLSALHTAPPGKARWGTRPLSLEALIPPGKGLQAVLPDIFGVLAVLGLWCCAWAFSSCGEQGLLTRRGVRASHCGVLLQNTGSRHMTSAVAARWL